MLKFVKMHGLGNDFVIVDARGGAVLPDRAKIAALTDRNTGIGCDQFIVIHPPKDLNADAYMQILNAPDASEAEACGNATRCVADILMRETGKNRVVIQTIPGLIECWREADGRITADMGVPKFGWRDIPLAREMDTLYLPLDLIPSPRSASLRDPLPVGEGDPALARSGEGLRYSATAVNMGNPHAVFFVDDVENFDVKTIGPKFETDPIFPNKANIEFAQIINPTTIRMRVWERSAGETLACGSAACATHVAAVRRGLAGRKARVIVNGGALDFVWRESDDHVLMTGAVAYVFEGVIK